MLIIRWIIKMNECGESFFSLFVILQELTQTFLVLSKNQKRKSSHVQRRKLTDCFFRSITMIGLLRRSVRVM